MSIYSCLIWVNYHVQNWTKYCRKLSVIVKPNILLLCNVTVRPMRNVTVGSGIALCLFFILGFNFAAGLIPLKYYETISSRELRHSITKRGISPSQHKYNSIRELSFHVLGRDFRLILNPSNGLLSPFFKAYTINSVGLKKPVSIQKENFFEGHVFGEKNSDVSVHIEEGMMTASIQTPDETYVVEPAWRHLPDHDNTTMIAYRTSDIKETRDGQEGHLRFCGYVREEGNLTVKENKQDIKLVKRQTSSQYRWEPVHTRCSLLLVADHLFYQNMGGSDLKGTINYLISLIDRVNKVYLETEWNSNDKQGGFRGMGFVIQEVMVHTESTPVVRGEVHYNMADYEWNVRDLLEVFSRSSNHRTFCLAHLFTDQKFDGGILGLAYVGSPRRNSVGGICSPGYVKNGHTLYLNSGLSTSRNHYGKRVITREADLVTAHEFGHNWGSEHDPDIPECSPNSRHGGSFLMYTYSVSGYDRNNKMFSPCSRRSIFAVLEAKAQKCFSEPEASFCGNSLVEENEQCDAGLIGSEDNDPCCDTDCKLRNGAVCSDKNSPCCRGCRLIVTGDICRQAQRNACKQEAYCNGRSAECPESKPQEDDKECLDRGRCKNGECVPFCETMGQHSCMCDQEKDACKRCCRSTLNSTCRPVPPEEILRDGTPCIHGYCEEGVCKKTVQDIVERFWDIVEDININTVLKFLNDNIVGTVIVISIIVWIPASCVINHFDNKKLKRKKELERERELMDRRQNETPFRVPTDGETRIIHIRGRSRPNNNQNNMGRGMPPLHPRPETERWEYRPRYNGASYRRAELMPFPLHGVDYRPSRHYPYSRGRGQPPNPAEYRPTGSQPDIVEAYTAL